MKIIVKNLKYAQLRVVDVHPKSVDIMIINRLAENDLRPTSNITMMAGDTLDLTSSEFEINAPIWQWIKIFIIGRLIPAEPEE